MGTLMFLSFPSNGATSLVLAVNALVLIIWIYLWGARGGFWQIKCVFAPAENDHRNNFQWPGITVVIPARNEAQLLPITLPTMLDQDYPGSFHLVVVDDNSCDGTARVAFEIAQSLDRIERLTVVNTPPLPEGWTGKLWALETGIKIDSTPESEFLLFTDADIAYSKNSVRGLVVKTLEEEADLVSLMAHLQAKSFWERLLIPAFVYFFAMIYPFSWVNDPLRRIAAAAGGCILVRRESLTATGGISSIRGCLIDDCALARQIKLKQSRPQKRGKIWLGLTQEIRSMRCYHGLKEIWQMVTRTAFVQLRCSVPLLVFTVLALSLVFIFPPLCFLYGVTGLLMASNSLYFPATAITSLLSWCLMMWTYFPVIKWYNRSLLFVPLLPFVATLYGLMTVHSAWRHLLKGGNIWKGRRYQ